LEKFYIPTRYPDAYPEGSPYEFYDTEEAEKALKCSSKIIEFVRKRYDEQVGKAEKGREGKSS
jgi:HEPN domain-containing protein